MTGDDSDIAFLFAGGNFQFAILFGNAEQVGTRHDGGNEVLAGLRCVGLELGFVYGQRRSRCWLMRSRMTANGTWPE